MKILSVQAENFASYSSIEFTFDSQGLTLIAGPTGSGKSTLCDLSSWGLFGVTAKNGVVSDIIAWPGDKVTICTVITDRLVVARSRGVKPKDNDLYYRIQEGPPKRGKDLNDTQKLINQELNFDSDLFLMGTYYHEFSKLAQFFTTTAKARKEICEQIVDLNLAKNIQLKATEESRTLAKYYAQISERMAIANSRLSMLEKMLKAESAKADSWQISQTRKIQDFELRRDAELSLLLDKVRPEDHFDALLTVVDVKENLLGSGTCKECGSPKDINKRLRLNEERHEIKIRQNNNLRMFEQIKKLQDAKPPELETTNPHIQTVTELSQDLVGAEIAVNVVSTREQSLKNDIEDLDIIQDVIKDFRGALVKNTLVELENNTNALLSDYFDAEIKTNFIIEDADKIEVQITKDGNACNYTQLSKGQRQMLKLTFGISVMETVTNHHGIELNALFFDEALDSFDEATRLKAFRLFEHLSTKHSSVFVVDHSEALKAMFDNKYTVALVNGSSEIEKAG